MQATEQEQATLSALMARDRHLFTIEGIKGTAPKNPNMPDAHVGWSMTIECQGRKLETPFYQSALTSKAMQDKNRPSDARGDNWATIRLWEKRAMRPMPTLEDVLSCLLMDASGYDNSRNFEDWASEYGYDTDSRTAERTYQTVAEQSKALRHLLGNDRYNEYLNAENDY